ncbi:MAG: O-methyltransferase [Halofilum sp. (in: g-proteobacteria)]
MSARTLQLDDALQSYLAEHALREPAECRRLRERTERLDNGGQISSPEQVQLLALVARLYGVRQVLEVGTFTGYMPLWLAPLLPEARFVCVDRDRTATAIAREAWQTAGVDDRVDLRIAEAGPALEQLVAGVAAIFDLVYLDADKERQIEYYESCMHLVRPGGLIAVDNVLWDGRVADPACDDETTRAVRAFNDHVHGDDRVDLSLIPIGDGVSLIRRRT